MSAGSGGDGESDEEWRFSLDEIDAMHKGDNGEQSHRNGDPEGNIAGSLERNQPLEPGDIDLENALFVVLGALLVVGLIAAVVFGI
jgi:hypothetical protein